MSAVVCRAPRFLVRRGDRHPLVAGQRSRAPPAAFFVGPQRATTRSRQMIYQGLCSRKCPCNRRQRPKKTTIRLLLLASNLTWRRLRERFRACRILPRHWQQSRQGVKDLRKDLVGLNDTVVKSTEREGSRIREDGHKNTRQLESQAAKHHAASAQNQESMKKYLRQQSSQFKTLNAQLECQANQRKEMESRQTNQMKEFTSQMNDVAAIEREIPILSYSTQLWETVAAGH